MAYQTKLYYVLAQIKQKCTNPKARGYKNCGGKGVKICEEWANSFDAFYEWSVDNGYGGDGGTTRLTRIDADKDFAPDNCRWLTPKESAAYTNEGGVLSYEGREMTIREWSVELGIAVGTIRGRLRKGWSVEDALGEEVKRSNGTVYGSAKLTKEDVKVIRDTYVPFSDTHGSPSLSKQYGVSRTAILGVVNNTAWVGTDVGKARTLTHDGRTQTVKEWSDELGIKVTTIRQRLRKGESVESVLAAIKRPIWSDVDAGVSVRGNSKLSEDDVRQIRASYVPYSKTHGAGQLAKKFNVSTKTIKRIAYGESRKQVD